MKGSNTAALNEIREMLKEIAEGQNEILSAVMELREEQKRLFEEIRISNSGIISIPVRSELIN